MRRQTRDKKSLAEHLLEWAEDHDGRLVKFAKRRPLMKKLFEESGVKVLNKDECLGCFREDLKVTKEEVLVYSPFIKGIFVSTFINMRELKDTIGRGVKVKVITRPLKEYKDRSGVSQQTLENLSYAGIDVYLRRGFHEKAIIIDNYITYIGSANILSWPSSSDLMQRVEGSDVANEVLRKIALPKEDEIFVRITN